MRRLILVTFCLLAGCSGSSGQSPEEASPDGPARPGDGSSISPPAHDPSGLGVGRSGPRRLTKREYANTVQTLLGSVLTEADLQELPVDALSPFDNDYNTQEQWQQVALAAERLAEKASQRALADTARRSQLVGCTPKGPQDAECLRSFIQRFGRRALRRPLTAEEVDSLGRALQVAQEENNFYAAVDVVIRALLQDSEFLYRIEVGTPDPKHPEVLQLNGFEVASRLSFFLWGGPPDDTLLDLAEKDQLRTPEQLRAAAGRMLADPRAAEIIQRFHSLWLGYEDLPHEPELAGKLRNETRALIQRVLIEQRQPWLDLFRSDETFIDSVLARHYNLSAPQGGSAGWVSYGSSGRKGILAHGSVLSNGAHYGDSSPTLRGKFIQNKLFCTEVPKPDPSILPPGVSVDMPPSEGKSNCKVDRYAAHRELGACASCHNLMDPIGFGLENYDGAGRFRTREPKTAGSNANMPECDQPIAGEGEVPGVGRFHGPSELSDLLIQSNKLDSCAATQLYRFAMGHREQAAEYPALQRLISSFRESGHDFHNLLLTLVSDPAFSRRLAQ